jgi:GTP-binding protein EngB required for normal cell division
MIRRRYVMNNDLLSNLTQMKAKLIEIINVSYEDSIIDVNEKENLIKDIEKEKLRIGVVGQVKFGKSTLLNAMIFRNQILPVASTPMTASLSYITYGEEEKVEVEFFSPEEWRELEEVARSNNNGYEVQAAKELLKRAERVRDEILNLLGKRITISMEKINDYVGESGKYVPICKALKIYYPIENLRDVEFVDTPGFNDPIVSREARAKEFLNEADVVIVVLYAGRPFDKTDRDLMFKKIRNIGTGKVVVVMNKKDLVLDEEGIGDKALKRIDEEFKKGIREIKSDDDNVMYNVFKNSRVIPLSSIWALLGVMEEDDINKDENLKWYYDDHRKKFPFLKTKDDFILHSGLKDLEKTIDDILKKDKYRILVNKHLSFIVAKYNERISEHKNKITELELEKNSLNKMLNVINKELDALNRVKDDLKNFITGNINKLEKNLRSDRESIKHEIKVKLYDTLTNIKNNIPDKDMFEFHSTYTERCNKIVDMYISQIKSLIENKFYNYRKNEIESLHEFVHDLRIKIEELAGKYLSYSGSDFMKMAKEILDLYELELKSPKFDMHVKSSGWWFIGTGSARSEVIGQLKKHFERLEKEILGEFDRISQSIEGKVEYINEKLNEQTIIPILNSLERASKNYNEKERRVGDIDIEINEVKNMIESISNKLDSIRKEISLFMEENI